MMKASNSLGLACHVADVASAPTKACEISWMSGTLDSMAGIKQHTLRLMQPSVQPVETDARRGENGLRMDSATDGPRWSCARKTDLGRR